MTPEQIEDALLRDWAPKGPFQWQYDHVYLWDHPLFTDDDMGPFRTVREAGIVAGALNLWHRERKSDG